MVQTKRKKRTRKNGQKERESRRTPLTEKQTERLGEEEQDLGQRGKYSGEPEAEPNEDLDQKS